MSTTSTAASLPIVAESATSPSSRRRTVRWALARAEGRRLLAHPLFVLGMAFSVLLVLTGGGDSLSILGGGYLLFSGGAVWTLLVTCLAASRERRDAAQDFYDAQPLAPRVRTEAALLSLGWAGLAGVLLTAFATVVLSGLDGVLVIDGQRYALRPLELAQGPLLLLLAGAVGVLIGSWTRRAYPAVIGALVVFLPPVAWLPWSVFGDGVPQGYSTDWVDRASVGWHLTGLAGMVALAAAGALARHDRRPRVALLALAGLGAAVAGIALGMPTGDPPA